MRNRVLCFLSLVVAACVANCGGSDTVAGTESDPNSAPGPVVNPGGKNPGGACKSGNDCKSGNCSNAVCVPPKPVDPDAGSPDTPGCTKNEDCTTGCGDDHQCATAPSCTREHGGRSCGPDGNDDCCVKVKQGSYTLDKYLITAGRMRAFIERFNGDIQGFVKTLPAGKWNSAWNDPDALPSNIDEANGVMGAPLKRGCSPGTNTGRTYWTPKKDNDYSDFDQDTLDEKALNCVPWQMVQAMCAFDGGRLANLEELKAAFTNAGTTKYPWGDDYYDPSKADPNNRLNSFYNYNDTPLPANARKNDDGSPLDISFYVSPPGKYPLGNNKSGVADSAGNLLEWTGDQPRQFIWKADFEKHGKDAKTMNQTSGNLSGADIWLEKVPVYGGGGPWIWGNKQLGVAGDNGERNGYYSIGGRCAY